MLTMITTTTHPALALHNAGKSRRFDAGYDWTSYVVVVDGLPYVVTVYADGSKDVQAA